MLVVRIIPNIALGVLVRLVGWPVRPKAYSTRRTLNSSGSRCLFAFPRLDRGRIVACTMGSTSGSPRPW